MIITPLIFISGRQKMFIHCFLYFLFFFSCILHFFLFLRLALSTILILEGFLLYRIYIFATIHHLFFFLLFYPFEPFFFFSFFFFLLILVRYTYILIVLGCVHPFIFLIWIILAGRLLSLSFLYILAKNRSLNLLGLFINISFASACLPC